MGNETHRPVDSGTKPPIQGVRRSTMKPMKFRAALSMRKNPTRAESALWEALKGKKTGLKFRRQHCMWGYIADFYAPQANLVVEVDGSSHQDRADLDRKRDNDLAQHGITTIRFSNETVLNRIDHVVEVLTIIANSQRTSKKATRRHNPARLNPTTKRTAINTP